MVRGAGLPTKPVMMEQGLTPAVMFRCDWTWPGVALVLTMPVVAAGADPSDVFSLTGRPDPGVHNITSGLALKTHGP